MSSVSKIPSNTFLIYDSTPPDFLGLSHVKSIANLMHQRHVQVNPRQYHEACGKNKVNHIRIFTEQMHSPSPLSLFYLSSPPFFDVYSYYTKICSGRAMTSSVIICYYMSTPV